MLKKSPDFSELVTNNTFSTKIGEIEKKTLDDSKYIITTEFNKFLGEIFDERLKQAKLATITDLNSVDRHAIKNQEKIEKLQTHDLSFFIGQSYLDNNGSQNFLIFQTIFLTDTIVNRNLKDC